MVASAVIGGVAGAITGSISNVAVDGITKAVQKAAICQINNRVPSYNAIKYATLWGGVTSFVGSNLFDPEWKMLRDFPSEIIIVGTSFVKSFLTELLCK